MSDHSSESETQHAAEVFGKSEALRQELGDTNFLEYVKQYAVQHGVSDAEDMYDLSVIQVLGGLSGADKFWEELEGKREGDFAAVVVGSAITTLALLLFAFFLQLLHLVWTRVLRAGALTAVNTMTPVIQGWTTRGPSPQLSPYEEMILAVMAAYPGITHAQLDPVIFGEDKVEYLLADVDIDTNIDWEGTQQFPRLFKDGMTHIRREIAYLVCRQLCNTPEFTRLLRQCVAFQELHLAWAANNNAFDNGDMGTKKSTMRAFSEQLLALDALRPSWVGYWKLVSTEHWTFRATYASRYTQLGCDTIPAPRVLMHRLVHAQSKTAIPVYKAPYKSTTESVLSSHIFTQVKLCTEDQNAYRFA